MGGWGHFEGKTMVQNCSVPKCMASRGLVLVYLPHHHLLWTALCVPRCLVLMLRTSKWDSVWR